MSGYQKTVVVVGGGFAGIHAIKKLSSQYTTVLIDQKDFFVFKPLLDEFVVGTVSAKTIRYPYRDVIPGTAFIKGKALRYDPVQRQVIVQVSDKHCITVEYDYLILAMGAKPNDSPLSRRASMHIYDYDGALLAQQQMRDYKERLRRGQRISVAVIGGGPVGVEAAGLIKDFIDHYAGKYGNTAQHTMSIFTKEDAVLGFTSHANHRAGAVLAAKGISVVLRSELASIDLADTGYLVTYSVDAQTKVYACDDVIWCAGINKETLGEQRCVADAFLRLEDHNNIFVAGDVAYLPERVPELAQTAIQQGRLVADNIRRADQGRPLKRYTPHLKGALVTLGHLHEVAVIRKRSFEGAFAWLMHRIIYLIGMLQIDNPHRNIVMWFKDLFTDRYGYLDEK